MAPEQVANEPVGSAADVFGWAVTIVYAATGRRPFAGPSVAAVLRALLSEASDLSGVPESLRPLVATFLDKDPGRRPTADDLVAVLTRGTDVVLTWGTDAVLILSDVGTAPATFSPPAAGPTGVIPPDGVTRPAPRPVPRRALLAGAVAVRTVVAVLVVAMWPRVDRTNTGTAPFEGHTNDVRSVAVGTLDGAPVTLTGSDDESALVWNLRTARQIGPALTGHAGRLRSVALGDLGRTPVAITGVRTRPSAYGT
jgi:WD40 repeat protein